MAVRRTKKTTLPDDVFTKDALIASRRYAADRDILDALLEDGETYTIAEADNIITDYKTQEVN